MISCPASQRTTYNGCRWNMATNYWKASADVQESMLAVKRAHHSPRLDQAAVAVCFEDSKPFIRNKLNLGKVLKFSDLSKLWHGQKLDFCLVLCSDVWYSLLVDLGREALLDLQLTRCEVEYLPVTVEVNGRKKVVKDEWGRVQYTNQMRFNDVGDPVLRVEILGPPVFASNVRRYGLWFDDLVDLQHAIVHVKDNTGVPQDVEVPSV